MILGCCDTIGSQAGDVARTAWLVAGLPDHVPGVTIDRQCGSSQQAVHFAAQGVMSGTQDLVVAGGVQNMTAIPISAAMLVGQQYGFTTPFAESPGWLARYGDQEVSQFRSAEMIAEKWDISREEMEEFALASHDRARAAIAEGRFKNEIEPVACPTGGFDTDECPRETSLEKMAGLRAAGAGRPDHRRRRLPDLRRLVRDADRLRAGGRRPRADPAGPDPPPLGARRRPGLDADRPDPGDPARAGEDRPLDRRHRPVRVQRGVRVRRARLDEGDRRAARARSTSTAAASRSATRSAPPAPG